MLNIRGFKILIIFFLVAMPQVFGQKTGYISKVWSPDRGDGNYMNPVIHADYSDPDAIRVGNDYYMIASSFSQSPGLPILHSLDLVNWEITGYVLDRIIPDEHFTTVQHGGGVWAPSIRYHDGEFYIYYPDPDFGIYLTKATKITGPWSTPLLVASGKGLIDPCPLWDDDGNVYLIHAYAGSRAGIKSILVVRQMNPAGTECITEPVLVYDGHKDDPTIEGPKIYRRKNYYYIFAPAGGVKSGWQTVLRSKHIYGPYERKVVMDQGSTAVNGPHQGAWVNTQTGEDWFIHFQDKEAYGRVVWLEPMKWVSDWPVIGADPDGDGKGEPVLVYKKPNIGKPHPAINPVENDEFNSPVNGLQWQWEANPEDIWAYRSSSGALRMYSVYQPDSIQSIWNLPNILGQKFPAEEFTVKMKVNFMPKFKNEKFGLVILGTDYSYMSLEKADDGIYMVIRENLGADKNNKEQDGAIFPVTGNEFWLTVKVEKGGVCHFSYSIDDKTYMTIMHAFTAKPGKWVGARIGFFCLRNNITNDAGYADIDWFRIEKNQP